MDKNSVKKDILASFLECGILFPVALNTIYDHPKYVMNVLADLTKDGYIADRKIKIKNNNRTITAAYKTIRPRGVQWLQDNCIEEYPWLQCLPNPIPQYSTRVISNSEALYKYLQSITASIIFNNFGIKSVQNPNPIKRVRTGAITFQSMIAETQERYRVLKADNGNVIAKPAQTQRLSVYYHSRDIASCFKLSPSEVNQHAFSTHNGLLVVRSKSYLIYSGSSTGVMLQKGTVDRIKASIGNWLFKNGLSDELYDACKDGIIFCKNRREWVNTFQNFMTPTRSGKEKHLNQMFSHLYSLPISRDSMYELDPILYYGSNLDDEIIKEISKSDSQLTVKDKLRYNGHEAVLGFDMDIVKLQRLYREAMSEHNRDKCFLIICREWQSEYYKQVMPENVKYIKKNN